MPALALILHVIDGVDTGVGGPVSDAAAERAAARCRYLEARGQRELRAGELGIVAVRYRKGLQPGRGAAEGAAAALDRPAADESLYAS
jgi:hypothetical protein